MKIIIVTLLSFITSFANAQNHDHHADHSKKIEKITSSNKQFKSTKELKVRMEKILIQMKELEKKKEDKEHVKAYGGKIAGTVNDIFKTCKLEPEADEAIHPALGLILEGTENLNGGNYEVGKKKIHEALEMYHKNFK
jgi:hypothetical protein